MIHETHIRNIKNLYLYPVYRLEVERDVAYYITCTNPSSVVGLITDLLGEVGHLEDRLKEAEKLIKEYERVEVT